MTKKRRINSWANPFAFYAGMFDAGLQMTELLSASAQVIAHRTDMMAKAAKGELPLYHKEFTDMWTEKFVAGSESLAATMKHMAASRSGVPSPQSVMKAMAPYRKRASANAKRLGKK